MGGRGSSSGGGGGYTTGKGAQTLKRLLNGEKVSARNPETGMHFNLVAKPDHTGGHEIHMVAANGETGREHYKPSSPANSLFGHQTVVNWLNNIQVKQ